MIDLETIGDDYDGVFTTIGAVMFNPESGKIGKTFYESVNWESAIEAGRTVTPKTIKFWMSQSDEARAEIVKDGKPLEVVLNDLRRFLPTDCIVWGRGPTFDISKLENAYGFYNIPWNFRNIRCVRTVADIAEGLVERDDFEFAGEKHNALDDAIFQATYVSAMLQALKRAVSESTTGEDDG